MNLFLFDVSCENKVKCVEINDYSSGFKADLPNLLHFYALLRAGKIPITNDLFATNDIVIT